MLPHIALTEKTGEKHGGVFLIRIIQNPYFKSSMSCCKINNPQPNKKIDKQPPPPKKKYHNEQIFSFIYKWFNAMARKSLK